MRSATAIRPVGSIRGVGCLALSLFSLSPGLAQAASPIRFSGELGGIVSDAAGRPEPGAVVLLFNRQDQLLQRAATDAIGSFAFADLLPDVYSIHVSLSSFIPAVRERIQIRAGMRSLLEVNLSRVFSSVQLVSTAPIPGALMSDNWKWALRADSAIRPILRFLPVQPQPPISSGPASTAHAAVFTDSRALVRISATDGATLAGDGEADLGTQFAFATSVYGTNRLQLAGDLGYANGSAAPSAAIRTSFSREFADGVKPEISVTMRQIFLPLRTGQQGDSAPPAMRTLGVSFDDKTQISDSLQMRYGFAFDNVSFSDSIHYFSPYGKLIYALPAGQVDFTWTSGNGHPQFGAESPGANDSLQQDLAAVSALPRVTLMDGHAKVQRGDDYELGISRRFGSREFRVEAHQENVSNTTLTVSSQHAGLFPGDLMPDLFSNSSLFNVGRFENLGYSGSVTQDLGENYRITLTWGSVGVFSPQSFSTTPDSAEDLRKLMIDSRRQALTLRGSGRVRATGTRLFASYQWTDYRSAAPGPVYSTESARPEPGLNFTVRQPMPSIPRVPWRMEASAELRNLLAQGYLPLMASGGDRLLLIDTPRTIRGGLAFVF